MTKKVLIAEKLAEAGVQMLRDKGYEVDVKLDMTPEELVETIPAYHGLIVRSATQATREVIEAGTNLEIIGRAGVGVDNVDVDAATERGIIVCNAPTSNVVSAAEQTITLMLACARNTAQANASMKQGKWERSKFVGVELYQKTLAIFGLGRIGGLVADRARSFDMNLIGYDPYCSPERAEKLGVTLYETVEEIAPLADFITVHLPKTKETIGMFGPDEYALMKDGVILVNTARGGIYNVDSLADFVAAGKIGAVGIDVYEKEPCTESPLHEFDNVILTPHLGASTKEAQERAGTQIAEYVSAGLEGSIVATAVNMAPVPPEVMNQVGPYVPACQMMGSSLSQIRPNAPKNLKLTAAGSLADADVSLLAAGAISGLLARTDSPMITAVNAKAVASRHGVKVEMVSQPNSREYTSTVELDADGTKISCTLSEPSQTPRIVSLMDYAIDITPGTYSLIFEYVDKPGQIGIFGSILGKAGINITTMQVGMKPEDHSVALVYLNVETAVSEDVLDELREALLLDAIWHIKL